MTPPEPNAESWLMQSIIGFRDRLALAFGGVGTTKHENLGRIAEGLVARSDGTFVVEVGAVLHDLLPLPGSQHEYALEVPAERPNDAKQLHFSNQLVRVRYLRDGDPRHLLCPLYRLAEVRDGHTIAPRDAPFENLKTFVSARYEMAGSDADDALSSHLEPAILDFIGRINRVIAAHLLVATEQAGLLNPVYDYGSFDYMYLLIAGADPDKRRPERLGLSLHRNSLVTGAYTETEAATFYGYIAGQIEPDDVARLLRSAKGYIEGGVLHLALLQLAIAAELETTRYVHAEYLRRGVSKTKLDDRKAEITFSIMLNIEVMAIAPVDMKPDRQLIGRIDRIRNLRNDLMHYGKFKVTQQELRDLHGATKTYVQFLKRVAAVGEGAT